MSITAQLSWKEKEEIAKGIEQGSAEWHAIRSHHLGASDAPMIMGVSPWNSRRELWLEKLGLGKVQEENDAMRTGKESERIIRNNFIYHSNILVSPSVRFSRTTPFMMASLDGISECGNIAIECKLANKEDHFRALTEKVVPDKYYPQLQHIISVCDLGNGITYCSYNPYSFLPRDQFVMFDIPRDDEYIEKMIREEKKFWECVRNFEEPEPGPNDLKRMDSSEWREASNEWKQAKLQLQIAEEKEKKYRQQLIDLSEDDNCEGFGVKLLKVLRRGTIDYSRIEELKNLDLNKYRKQPTTSWRIIENV